MSEIEKLYDNAGVEKEYCGWLDMGDLDCQMRYVTCNSINEWKESVLSSRYGESEEEPELKYPNFTTEKQIELIKWLIANGHCYFAVSIKPSEFTEYLARYVNKVWQDLTDTEKAEIKRILE